METFENGKTNKHFHGKAHNRNILGSHSQLAGIVLVILGAALILKNADILPWPVENIIFSWQMLLVTVGLVITLGSSGDKTAGVVIMTAGAFFLMPKIFREAFDISIFWPVILIITGLIIIFSKRTGQKSYSETKTGDNHIDIVNIFGGSKRQIMSENFTGGKITSIFGGGEIDLTQANLAQEISELEVVCAFGGITIIVPKEWNVKVEVLAVIGGIDDERKIFPDKSSAGMSKQLIIKGVVIFGGGTIKSY
jgi:predicted membrane protein